MTIRIVKNLTILFILLAACQPEEKKQPASHHQVVPVELTERRQALMDSQQVKALLDSIDASRRVVTTPVGTENESQSTIYRLNDINEYIKDINLKMDQMEKSIKYVNSMASSILKLQADVEVRTQKIAKLEAEAKKVKAKERAVMTTLYRKDSTLAAFIQTCQQDIAFLQRTMEEVHARNNEATANLYYKQAETLSAMADKVSSSRRKTVKQEALELYRISFSLGKKEAEKKISALQRDL